jgi:hypothetical protein
MKTMQRRTSVKRLPGKLLTLLLLTTFCVAATAQVSSALAEKLIRKSGLWAQVEAIPLQVQAGLLQSPMKASIPEAEVNRMAKIAAQSFAPARMQKALVDSVAKQLKPEQMTQAMAWYDSAAGQLITAREEAATANMGDVNAALNEGNQTLENASPKRQALITAIIKASRSVAMNVDMSIHTGVAVFSGIVSSQTPQAGEAIKMFHAAMQAKRPQMIASTMGQTMALSAMVYDPVADEELEGYLQFLSGDTAMRMMDIMYQGLDTAFTQSAHDFGKQLLVKKDKAGV